MTRRTRTRLAATLSCLLALHTAPLAAQTVFSGGTLAALRALSPTLNFDHLVIDGPLQLAPFDDPVITVNRLTVAASGSIGYAQGTCDFLPAPDLTIDAKYRKNKPPFRVLAAGSLA